MRTKICNKCKNIFSSELFYKTRNWCRFCISKIRKIKYKENPDAIREYYKQKYHDDLNYKLKTIERSKARAKTPKVKKLNAYKCAKRKDRIRQATPFWADLNKIKEFYASCPKGMQVDHIVPIAGKFVCGLHVDYNLQYLTPLQNQSKRNYFKD